MRYRKSTAVELRNIPLLLSEVKPLTESIQPVHQRLGLKAIIGHRLVRARYESQQRLETQLGRMEIR